MKIAPFSDLLGTTLAKIGGLVKGSEKVLFYTNAGHVFSLHHYQDCCETVEVEDVAGDVSDILNSPILRAEERTGHYAYYHGPLSDLFNSSTLQAEEHTGYYGFDNDMDLMDLVGPDSIRDLPNASCTWTFYELATIKGSVTIRWIGSSSGYYSEEVTFERIS